MPPRTDAMYRRNSCKTFFKDNEQKKTKRQLPQASARKEGGVPELSQGAVMAAAAVTRFRGGGSLSRVKPPL